MNSKKSIFLRALLLMALVLTFTAQPAQVSAGVSPQSEPEKSALGPMPTWDKSYVDAPPYFVNMTDRSFAFNRSAAVGYSQPCMAYGGDRLYYSCQNKTTLAWNTVIVDDDIMVGEYAALTFDNYARPFITYYDGYNGVLKLAYFNGVSWVKMIVPDATGVSAAEELGIVDTPVPADDVDTFEEIQKLQRDEGPKTLEREPDFAIPAIGYGKFSSISIDDANGVHISYYDEVNGSLEYQYWNGVTWDGKVVDDYRDQGKVGLWSSIKVDVNRNVNIAYMSEKYDDLKYARRKATGGWTIETIDSDYNVGSFSSIALDTSRLPHISYYDFTHDNLKHAWEDKNGLWHKEVIDGNGWTGWYTSIAIDSGNRIHISYYSASKGDLKYARYANGKWTISTLDVSNPANIGLFTSIDIDGVYYGQNPTGYPGVFYTDAYRGAAKFLYRPGTVWWKYPSYVAYYSRDVGVATSMAVNSEGVPFISYLDASAGLLKYARSYGSMWARSFVIPDYYAGMFSSIKLASDYAPRIAFYNQDWPGLWYGAWNGVNWSFSIVDDTYDVGQYVSLALDSTGLPHMSYYDVKHADLVYASWSVVDSDWYTQTVDFEYTQGWYTSIALDSANLPFISYYDPTSGSLKLAYKSPILTWVVETVDNIGQLQEMGVGWYSSIAMDNLGRPNIAYYDRTNHQLKYAFWNGTWGGAGFWDRVVVDNVGDVGRFSSLAIYPVDNTRHICYYDYTLGNLKYARWSTGIGWEKMVVDDLGDVGQYCSIALNGLGEPAITYYDNSRGDLKIALSYALPPAKIFLPMTYQEVFIH